MHFVDSNKYKTDETCSAQLGSTVWLSRLGPRVAGPAVRRCRTAGRGATLRIVSAYSRYVEHSSHAPKYTSIVAINS